MTNNAEARGAGSILSGRRLVPAGTSFSAATCMGLVINDLEIYAVGKRPEEVSFPSSSTPPSYLGITNTFDQSQIRPGEIGAFAVIFLSDVFGQNVVGWRWYGPAGNLVGTVDYTIPARPDGWGWYYVWSGLINSVHLTTNGDYRVDILWNGSLIRQFYFSVTGIVPEPQVSEFQIVDYIKV